MENRTSSLFDIYVCRSSEDIIADSYYFIDLDDDKEKQETTIFQTCTWFGEGYSGKVSRSIKDFNKFFYTSVEDAFPDWAVTKPNMSDSSTAADYFRMFLINYLFLDKIGITDKLSKLNDILNHVRMVIDFKARLRNYFNNFTGIHISVIPTINYQEENDIVEIIATANLYLKSKDLKETEIRLLGAATTDCFASSRLTLIELLSTKQSKVKIFDDSFIIRLLFPRDSPCIDSLLNRKFNNLREILKEYVS